MSFTNRFGCEEKRLAVLHVVFAVVMSVRMTVLVEVLLRHFLKSYWKSQLLGGGIIKICFQTGADSVYVLLVRIFVVGL